MKTVRVLGASLVGTGAELVTVEARFDRTDRERTEVVLSGLPDPVLREARGRLECALRENGVRLTNGRLFLNLVPAARRKSGEILDLPLALGAAAALGHLDRRALLGTLFLGELGIDGRLHAVPGGLAAALTARGASVTSVVAPPATAIEAACVEDVTAFGAAHLAQVLAHVTEKRRLRAVEPPDDTTPAGERPETETNERPSTLDEVRGLGLGKHALAVAAAGGHGLLFVGPPGAGKSMLARRLVRLLPAPSLSERLEITSVLSAGGRWPGGLARTRPLRAPHHTVSYAGLVGGGPGVHAGEVTLAHRGVLFLDELPEFRREALEALRQPIEAGSVLISRAGRQTELPARFHLVAAMNPCPCGYLGHPRVPCRCPPSYVQRYRHRVSGPLLDRIDLRIELSPPSVEELVPGSDSPPSSGPDETELRERVDRARRRSRARQAVDNADLEASELDRVAGLDAEAQRLVLRAAKRQTLSARALQSLRRVARTLADLEDRHDVAAKHVAEALALRAEVRDARPPPHRPPGPLSGPTCAKPSLEACRNPMDVDRALVRTHVRPATERRYPLLTLRNQRQVAG